METTRYIRLRYGFGLSALALLILGTHLFLVREAARDQDALSTIIHIAGSQTGLTNRIAFFTERMMQDISDDERKTARQQIGRAINQIQSNHKLLIHGDEIKGIPKVFTETLQIIYFDNNFGLDVALERFLTHVNKIQHADPEDIGPGHVSVIFVTNYGPYVLETLLNSAVIEYEAHARRVHDRVHRYQNIAVAAALILLIIEAIFIFRPLEKNVKRSIEKINAKNKETEFALEASEALNKTKDTFLSNVSHELRTPLNAIIGFSEALLVGVYGKLSTVKQRERLQDVHSAARHLLNLVNDILLLRAADGEDLGIDESVIRIQEMLNDVRSLIQPIADKAGIQLNYDYGGVDFLVFADQRRINQILLNLINNAIKYTPRGGQVYVWAGRLKTGEAAFRITDTGIGMTEAEVSMARGMFQRIETEYTRNREGTGLGLPVSIELAKAHGGDIRITSEKGAGTVVTVVLPASRVLDETADISA